MALVEFNKIRQLFGETPGEADPQLFRELFVLVLSSSAEIGAQTTAQVSAASVRLRFANSHRLGLTLEMPGKGSRFSPRRARCGILG